MNLVVSEEQAVMGHLLLSVVTVLRLADSVVVPVAEVGHKRRRVLLSQHPAPVNFSQPRVAHHLLYSVVSQSG